MSVTSTETMLLPVGRGGWLAFHRVVAIARYDSAPVRRLVRQAARDARLLDLTFGHATAWVAFIDSGHVVLLPHEALSGLAASPSAGLSQD